MTQEFVAHCHKMNVASCAVLMPLDMFASLKNVKEEVVSLLCVMNKCLHLPMNAAIEELSENRSLYNLMA